MISDEIKQQILDATDIVELIGSYFPLKRAGTNFVALCPFHSEKSGSFNVSPARQFFHCFGCKESGDAISFVRKYENLDYAQAVKRLAERAGITVREEVMDAADLARLKLRSQLIEIHREAAAWFQKILFRSPTPDAAAARDYLSKRGISKENAENWRIGFAPADSSRFLDWARKMAFTGKALEASGLTALKDENHPSRGLYTRFRDRIMFPIANDYGEVIAFSGRLLDPDAKAAKYINSPQTILFDKGKHFFGLDKSKRAILAEQRAIVFEGQVDLITAFEAGIENIIAPLGTAFTADHARLLKRFTGEAILCFDSDAAGYKAADRTFAELAGHDIVVRAVEMPPGQDPDSLIRAEGIEGFRQRVEEAKPFHEFQIDHMASVLDLSSIRDRVQFANVLATTVARIHDPVYQDGVVHSVSTRLGIAADDFRKRVANVARSIRKGTHRTENPDAADPNEPPLVLANKDVAMLCKLALTHAEVREWLTREKALMTVLESVPESKLLSTVWGAEFSTASPGSVNAFLSSLPPREEACLHELIMARTPGTSLVDAQRAVKRLEIAAFSERIKAEQSQLGAHGITSENIYKITNHVCELKKELLDLKRQLTDIA
jgi:DNA primase